MPGVPDIYQGAESSALWLTDPDNRQPVNFPEKFQSLKRLLGDGSSVPPPIASPEDLRCGELKQYVTTRLLRFRRDNRRLLAEAGYVPIRARGVRAAALVAFRRTRGREHVIVAVPRLIERSAVAAGWPVGPAFWGDTELRVPTQVGEGSNLLEARTVYFKRPSHAPMATLGETWPWVVLHGREMQEREPSL